MAASTMTPRRDGRWDAVGWAELRSCCTAQLERERYRRERGPMTRPPHRPSRRSTVVDAAMGLFALHPPEHVTVADIAAAADMTAAAVYYHFPSKEHVLLEGLQLFTGAVPGDDAGAAPRTNGDGPWAAPARDRSPRVARGGPDAGDGVLRPLGRRRRRRSRRCGARRASSRSICWPGRIREHSTVRRAPASSRRSTPSGWCR